MLRILHTKIAGVLPTGDKYLLGTDTNIGYAAKIY